MAESKNNRKNGKATKKHTPLESNRDIFLAEVADMHSTCVSLVVNSANIGGLIKSASTDVTINLDVEAVNGKAVLLAGDVSKLKIELDAITESSNTSIKTLTHTTDELDVMEVTINVANKYSDWQERFMRVTGPTMSEITDLCLVEHVVEEIKEAE